MTESPAFATDLGISFLDIRIHSPETSSIEFTFLWEDGPWEGRNYRVNVRDLGKAGSKAA
jgi:hypothetical protein